MEEWGEKGMGEGGNLYYGLEYAQTSSYGDGKL